MAQQLTDRWGVPVDGSEQGAVDSFDSAVEDLVSLSGDPVARAEEAALVDPLLGLARILGAYLDLYATTPKGTAAASAVLADLGNREPELGERERIHLRAARSWAAGELEAATRAWEDALLLNPRDLLALKVAQDLYFFLGDRLNLRDSAARVLATWAKDQPGWGYVQGIYAFGLEENGAYAQAEEQAHAALAVEPGDVWAVHAIAHVLEMQGRQGEGTSFLAQTAPDWEASYFAIHNWWHQSLYFIELLDFDSALALYDHKIRASRSDVWLDLVDAASLLWRLHLYGVDIGDRLDELAATMEPLADGAIYVFNDWHLVMVFGLAGRHELSRRVLANQQRTLGTNRRVGEVVGVALLEAFTAFAAGEHKRAAGALLKLRPHAHAVGGSHAQRDVIDLTLLAAAAAARDDPLVRALVSERKSRKPTSSAAIDQLVRVSATR